MERIEVDVITGEIKVIPLTQEEVDIRLAQVIADEALQQKQSQE